MILRKLYEEYDVDIDKIILRDYKKLGLKYIEATMLLVLLSMYRKKRSFSVSMLAKKTDLKKEKVEEITHSLIQKGFMSLGLEKTKDDKEREVFDLDNTFTILEDFLYQTEIIKEQKTISETILLLEETYGRVLTDNELETIRRLYEEEKYSHEEILKAIEVAKNSNKTSLKVVEKILINNKKIATVEVDEKTRKVLDDIFKAIK